MFFNTFKTAIEQQKHIRCWCCCCWWWKSRHLLGHTTTFFGTVTPWNFQWTSNLVFLKHTFVPVRNLLESWNFRGFFFGVEFMHGDQLLFAVREVCLCVGEIRNWNENQSSEQQRQQSTPIISYDKPKFYNHQFTLKSIFMWHDCVSSIQCSEPELSSVSKCTLF